MKFALQALAACCAMALLDVVFALYVIALAAHDALQASALAAGCQLCNALVVVSYVKDRRLILAVAAGAFIGTWAAVELF